MTSKLSKIITIILTVAFGLNGLIAPSTYAAGDPCASLPSDSPAYEAAGCKGSKDELPQVIVGILNAIITVSGIIAVIFVIIGGINYMTSAGDPGKIEKAKKTILYAVIGLAITVLAFAIVNFVISNILGNKSTNDKEKEDKTSLHIESYRYQNNIN